MLRILLWTEPNVIKEDRILTPHSSKKKGGGGGGGRKRVAVLVGRARYFGLRGRGFDPRSGRPLSTGWVVVSIM